MLSPDQMYADLVAEKLEAAKAGVEELEVADPGAEGPEAAGLSAERGTGREGKVSRRLKRTHWRPWPRSRPCLSLGKPQTFWE